LKLIIELKEILASEARVFQIIREELTQVREQFGDKRRTEIVLDEATEFEAEDLIADEPVLVSITHSGYVKRANPSTFKSQHRGGKGIRAVQTGDEDFVTAIYRCNTLSYLLCFTDRGRLYWLKVYRVPEASRGAKGKAIVNLINLAQGEKIQAILPVREFRGDQFVTFVTRAGIIKKTPLSDFSNVRNTGLMAITIDDGDELIEARLTSGQNDVFLVSKSGMSIRFGEDDVRPMGRAARGVIGMSLDEGDRVVSMEVLDTLTQLPFEILTITDQGYGKRTPVGEYRVQTRGGKGIITMRTADKNGQVMGARQVLPKDDVMLVSDKGQMIRVHVGEISEQGRNTQGVRVMNVSSGEKVVSFEYMAEESVVVSEEASDAAQEGPVQ
jgi:DNA gyrase subunit A